MGLIQDKIREWRNKKQQFRDYSKDREIEEVFTERKKDSNERELERYREQDRKAMIKQIVERRRKQENDEIWSGHKGNPIDAPNVTSDHKKIFSGGNMFAHQQSMLGGSNLFFKK